VTQFLEAVYTDRDARRAGALACTDARNEDTITRKVDEIAASARRYRDPRFSWEEPRVEDETSDRALVIVKITLTTGDDRIAEQRLGLTVVRKDAGGWWVCEVESR
jgi:hypothetical protein